MVLDFQQGIVTYPSALSLQSFLSYNAGFVSLQTTNGHVDVTFAHGQSNYLLTEASNVVNAWGPLVSGIDYWLYWDINLLTGVRTFGTTQIPPTHGAFKPPAPVTDQHWFDTTNKRMYVYNGSQFVNVVRVFACKINSSTLVPLGTGIPSAPYAGTQVGLNTSNVASGRIISDNTGMPIRRVDGRFFTSEDDFFVNGSPVNVIRLEANIVSGTALTNIARFQVVKFAAFGQLSPAQYEDVGSSAIAMLMEDLTTGQTGTVAMQGLITNPQWNWPVVGATLWVDDTGALTPIDPHVANALVYPNSKVPVARVISQTSVFFDQGLGGKGDRGETGLSGGVSLATTTIFGVARLSTPALDIGTPIVVGDNDTRLTDKVQKTGDVMTGPLILSGDPIVNMGAATKQYVDSRSGTPRSERFVATAGQTVLSTTITVQASTFPTMRIQIFVNGILQLEGPTGIFTVTGANQITFSTPLEASDDVVVVTFG